MAMEAAEHPDRRAYVWLAAVLRSQIAGGRLAQGDSVPSIAVLSREHSISRRTAGSAMQLLEREGLIFRVPGLGYFVS